MADSDYLYDESRAADPVGDDQAAAEAGTKRNYAKVGSGRPSSLLYTYGPGAIMDLPHFTVLPLGLDDWDRVWARRPAVKTIHAPRLLEAVRTLVAPSIDELRPFPWRPSLRPSPLKAPTWVCPLGFSRNGCAAPVVTGSLPFPSSITRTPNDLA